MQKELEKWTNKKRGWYCEKLTEDYSTEKGPIILVSIRVSVVVVRKCPKSRKYGTVNVETYYTNTKYSTCL